jgi:hypothetical protein
VWRDRRALIGVVLVLIVSWAALFTLVRWALLL